MTKAIWEKFDKAVDTKALKEDAAKAAEQGDFPEVPHGTYEVKIEKLELGESKNGNPMMVCWMEILDGEFKGNKLFYYQVMHVGFGIHKANEFLRALDSGVDIEFESFKQYNDLLLDVHEAIDGNLEYVIYYGEDKKGYSIFEIEEVFVLD